MGELHMTKVAYGCSDIETVEAYVAARVAAEGEHYLFTRFMPKRVADLAGGSLYWIIRSRLACRQKIIGFTEAKDEQDRTRVKIGLEPTVVRLVPRHFRPHQGWRYLEAADAPLDLADAAGGEELPPALLAELANLRLI